MLPLGMAIVAFGIIGIIWGIFQKIRAGRVADAPFVSTGDAAAKNVQMASPKGAISVEGNVICAAPLTSPVSGVPCLWYQLKSKVTWKDGDVEKTKDLDNQKVAAQFSVDDGSGAVVIDASEGGDFEPMVSKSESKTVGLIGGIKGTELKFGNYSISTGMGSIDEKYEVEEQYMPMQPRLYVCGKVENNGVIKAPGWRSLLMYNKSRDEVLGSALKTAKLSLIGGGVAFAVGSAIALVAQMNGEGASSTPAAAASADDSTKAGASGPAKKAPATTKTTINKK